MIVFSHIAKKEDLWIYTLPATWKRKYSGMPLISSLYSMPPKKKLKDSTPYGEKDDGGRCVVLTNAKK
jgi:hypothetical protein